jgi:quinol-cytochrome oxidoreductase complex cytochrome b subunit
VGGVLLFFLVLGFGFTGYLLPWSQLSYWATTVGTEVGASIPMIGAGLGMLLRGGEAIGQETLSRFYVVHVVVLPWILAGLIVIHIVLIRTQGLAPLDPVGQKETPLPGEGIRFSPEHLSREFVVFPLFFALLVLLVILFPPEIGQKADPTSTPEGIKPEWYFLPTYQFLKYLPKYVGLLLAVLPPVLLLAWPFIDRSPWRRASQRKLSVALGLAALAITVLLGVVGWLSERELELFGRQLQFDMYGVPHRVEPNQQADSGGE